jgi:hypothetical protein
MESTLNLRMDPEAIRGVNPLRQYFNTNHGNALTKWDHYLDIYHEQFRKFRGLPVVVLEIGVMEGGSLEMWREYFGPAARIFGIDNDPSCTKYTSHNIEVIIGSQDDPVFLRSLQDRMPRPDIIIDDGGHYMRQQRTSFEHLFPWLDNHGLYLVEDLHTSYFSKYGGGYKRDGTFVEYGKSLVDRLNEWHYRSGDVSRFCKTIHSLSFYDSIMVVAKKPLDNRIPISRISGTMHRDLLAFRSRNAWQWMVYIPSRVIELVLSWLRLRSINK